jgi:hypothetical protein
MISFSITSQLPIDASSTTASHYSVRLFVAEFMMNSFRGTVKLSLAHDKAFSLLKSLVFYKE